MGDERRNHAAADPAPVFTMAQLEHHFAVWWSRYPRRTPALRDALVSCLRDLQHQADLKVKMDLRKKFK